jgi:hypothetical protein
MICVIDILPALSDHVVLRGPNARADQSVSQSLGIEECSDKFQQPLALRAFGNQLDWFVIVDSIEKQN